MKTRQRLPLISVLEVMSMRGITRYLDRCRRNVMWWFFVAYLCCAICCDSSMIFVQRKDFVPLVHWTCGCLVCLSVIKALCFRCVISHISSIQTDLARYMANQAYSVLEQDARSQEVIHALHKALIRRDQSDIAFLCRKLMIGRRDICELNLMGLIVRLYEVQYLVHEVKPLGTILGPYEL